LNIDAGHAAGKSPLEFDSWYTVRDASWKGSFVAGRRAEFWTDPGRPHL